MALPIYQTDSKDLSLLQTNWAQQINPVLNLPTNKGQVLKSISLVTGSNQVSHRLGRNLQGWFLVRQRGAASVYDQQDAELNPSLFLSLVSSANVSVDIFVF